jgi:hypothetical protein
MRLMRTASEKTLALLAEGSDAGIVQRNVKALGSESSTGDNGRADIAAAAAAAAAAASVASQLHPRPQRHDADAVQTTAAIANASAAVAASAHQQNQQVSLLKLEHKLKEGADVMDVLNRELQVRALEIMTMMVLASGGGRDHDDDGIGKWWWS